MRDREREADRHRGIDRVAARFQNLDADARGVLFLRRHHAVARDDGKETRLVGDDRCGRRRCGLAERNRRERAVPDRSADGSKEFHRDSHGAHCRPVGREPGEVPRRPKGGDVGCGDSHAFPVRSPLRGGPLCAARDPARRHAGGMRRQQHSDPGRDRQGEVVAGAQPVSAPRRPDSQPGRDREGLCPAGSAGARSRRGRAGARHRGAGAARHADQSGGVQEIPGSAVAAFRRARPPAGDQRELSGPEIESEFPRAAVAARRHREPYRGRAARLHRGGAGLQHRAARRFPA